ncbi:MAG: HDOD domain-containing protein [Burkholderiaceae bacterium]
MPVDPELRTLEIAVPSQPEALVKLSLLMAEQDANLAGLAALIEADMGLASAVLRAVNSSLYGVSGRVQSVQQAITFLGMREIAAITLEMGLRAVFPPAVELEPIWQRAALRGVIMGRLGQAIDVDAWAAHSAGLFEECGKAVLFRHAPDHYRAMLRAAAHDSALCETEIAAFGVSHDALGAALCESWGLSAAAVVCVRHHVAAQAELLLPPSITKRSILMLSVLARAMMRSPEAVEALVPGLAAQADLDEHLVLRGVRSVGAQLQAVAGRS